MINSALDSWMSPKLPCHQIKVMLIQITVCLFLAPSCHVHVNSSVGTPANHTHLVTSSDLQLMRHLVFLAINAISPTLSCTTLWLLKAVLTGSCTHNRACIYHKSDLAAVLLQDQGYYRYLMDTNAANHASNVYQSPALGFIRIGV